MLRKKFKNPNPRDGIGPKKKWTVIVLSPDRQFFTTLHENQKLIMRKPEQKKGEKVNMRKSAKI